MTTIQQPRRRRAVKILAIAAVVASAAIALAQTRPATEEPLDVPRARRLMERSNAGEKLSPEDQAYLDRVRREVQNRQGKGGKGGKAARRPPATAPESE